MPDSSSLEARVRELEQQLQATKERIAAIERFLAERGEHPVDSKVTRSKVTYDWQA